MRIARHLILSNGILFLIFRASLGFHLTGIAPASSRRCPVRTSAAPPVKAPVTAHPLQTANHRAIPVHALLAAAPPVQEGSEVVRRQSPGLVKAVLTSIAVYWLAVKASVASFLSGGFGGICLVLVGHPLDSLKVKLQSMTTKPGEEPQYKGMWDCALKTIQKEGPFGLYRGISAPLLGIAPVFALCFWSYDLGERLMRMAASKSSEQALTLVEVAIAGGFSAIPTTLLMTPMERVKCLLQVQDANPKEGEEKYYGMMDCARKLIKTGGLPSLFKGMGATVVRDVPASIAYFFVYAYAKQILSKGGSGSLSTLAVLCAGGLAGIANWLVCIPPDTVKTRLQTAPEGKYSNYFDVWKDVLQNDGFLGLYKGIVPVLIRAFPANAACFFGVEVARKFLSLIGM